MFSLPVPAGEKALRSLLVFVFLVIALRLGGKREIGQITTLDLVVLLLVSNVLQNAMIGNDNSVVGGFIGAATLLAANFLLVRITFRSRLAREVVEGRPSVLVDQGKVDEHALRREAITINELRMLIYDKGFDRLGDVPLIVLEPNGRIAALKEDAAADWRRENVGDT
jgi:uncharacterized membrane protein YcaP (DUF421 family)